MDSFIALALKLTGLGKLWDTMDGYKTQTASAGLMLAGLGMMISGVSAVIAVYAACADHACQIGVFRGLGQSEGGALALKGFIVFKGGLAALGIGHKIEKANAEDDSQPTHVSVVDPEKP